MQYYPEISYCFSMVDRKYEYESGAPRGPKVMGGQRPQISKNVPLKSVNTLFTAFSYYNFKKSRGSADPADPVLAGYLTP